MWSARSLHSLDADLHGSEPQALGNLHITAATSSDTQRAVACLVTAFAQDPITGFLLQTGPDYQERVAQFFSLLMSALVALNMPVLVAPDTVSICGAAMGNTTESPPWSAVHEEEWKMLETASLRLQPARCNLR